MWRHLILAGVVGAGMTLYAWGFMARSASSALPSWTAPSLVETPVRRRAEPYAGGYIVCVDGATGYETTIGMIVALNERGRMLARTAPTNCVWSDTAGLIDAAEVAYVRRRAERLC